MMERGVKMVLSAWTATEEGGREKGMQDRGHGRKGDGEEKRRRSDKKQ